MSNEARNDTGGDTLLTVEEVATELRVHPDTVRIWLRQGRLKGSRLTRRAGWRIRRSDVAAFLEEGTSKAAA